MTETRCGFAEAMEKAGAILLGKTNSPVMGFRGTCDNPLFGPTQPLRLGQEQRRVPKVIRPNEFSATTPFIFEGPITRSVADAALVMGALARYDPRDPFSSTRQSTSRAP